ncbi:phosphoribosylformylglycinamidine synthase [Nitritalea halalkaliphila LW7]|uniref:Phosphoribosylformylglycinamidine synthase n=1 Tax=Nitritalea halalkaliphila LW7 TaxID=1189621 RepID=I5C540_9BACT|nr:phosphoribosylformylglycinamidine synthase [Nitritalea halalkaliphila]EIM76942.1 phosphoribosylformylglycinamidine synthase [Nitritalea halalkaliphila LW7]
MIRFFQTAGPLVYALETETALTPETLAKLAWLFDGAQALDQQQLPGPFIGPRKEMLTPWSTNAVEICLSMGISGIKRIECFEKVSDESPLDPMLQQRYTELDQSLFHIALQPEAIRPIEDIAAYNQAEGLALSQEEVDYLNQVSAAIGRPLTDSEVFGFSQVNSEHCRHKIFNGTFRIDGQEKEKTLFQLIKATSKAHPNRIVSAYKDNVAFVKGPAAVQFAPLRQDQADFFAETPIETVLSLKAETHNFPTTVEPFNGAATGSGGEIRDRMAGGTASIPLAGTAVYMTAYPRTEAGRPWEEQLPARPWRYQSPQDILIKASNGASDFGNKFGQPLISGSLLTFEHQEGGRWLGFDKVIMQAGGVGFTRAPYSLKKTPSAGDKIILMGGDNYRIGMGGSAVSSVNTGAFSHALELNAIQRSNPEMQKRVANVIRAMAESDENPIISIHDHGAGGHLNCLSELVETTGGKIALEALPVGDPTLSAKEIIGNESQERMGLLVRPEDTDLLRRVAQRERAPFYEIGETTGDMQFTFEDARTGEKPVDWSLHHMFGSSPKTILEDSRAENGFAPLRYETEKLSAYLEQVLQLEAVACKDWLTNKVDRSVTGRVAKQQTTGELQLPLNNVAVMALDFQGTQGIATSIGHAPVAALASPEAGSRLAIAEALTNIIWSPIEEGLTGVSLSANWMWPAKNAGENDRLYRAVEAVSDFAIALGINIPTGKDSLSMTQQYPDGQTVYAPGTVIISAIGTCTDIQRVLSPDLAPVPGSSLYYIDFSSAPLQLGGSALAQVLNQVGTETPDVLDANYFRTCFDALQQLIQQQLLHAGHDISSGGLVTTLLEMCFPSTRVGLDVQLEGLGEADPIKMLFAENPGVVIQVKNAEKVRALLDSYGVRYVSLGKVTLDGVLNIPAQGLSFPIATYRQLWYRSSYLLDKLQSGAAHAEARYTNYSQQPLMYSGLSAWQQRLAQGQDSVPRGRARAAIIREKGVNGDREMAFALYAAGFEVKDIHMTDLISGAETLEDVHMIAFVGGFSNSDVLGSAKGWAGAFLYNEKAKKALDAFYARPDTLSLGVCNGCQLMVALGLLYPEAEQAPKMEHNRSGKFESAFLNVTIPSNQSVMLGSLAGTRLGVWIAHGEGRFHLPAMESYRVAMTYSYAAYPGNPNGSDADVAALVSQDGRHLAMMPHIERSLKPWNWPYLSPELAEDPVSPWMEAFQNAYNWIAERV